MTHLIMTKCEMIHLTTFDHPPLPAPVRSGVCQNIALSALPAACNSIFLFGLPGSFSYSFTSPLFASVFMGYLCVPL